MRAIWKGAVAFGLVNVPVKLYAATGEHSVPLHQVHRDDGGRIRYRKVCSVCGEEVRADEIAKGYETGDGRMVVLTEEDLDQLPLATEREIAVEEFVPADQVDPIMLGRTYYLEPDRTAAKPYALLREALKTTDRMAVVKVALRQRESMAVLRVRGDVICLQTLLWPDEVREADFPFLETEVAVRPQELQMAASLVESLAADFDPSAFEDSYRTALEQLIEAKVSTGTAVAVQDRTQTEPEGADVVDLLSALQRSVERARDARAGSGAGADAGKDEAEAPAKPARAARARTAAGTAGAGKAGTAGAGKDGAAEGTGGGTARAPRSAAAASTTGPAEGRKAATAPGAGKGTKTARGAAAQEPEPADGSQPRKKTAARRRAS